MNTTYLNLHIQDVPDFKSILLTDLSSYNPDLPISNPILEITVPNFSTVYTSEFYTSQNNVLNSNVLQWTNTLDTCDLSDLPDGLWTFTLSVNPNAILRKEHVHYRIINLRSKILSFLSEQNCDKNENWYIKGFILLHKLDVLKFMAEKCGKCKEANIMYNAVLVEFSNLNCDC